MSRHKTRKFLELKTMSNVFEDGTKLRGRWNTDYFDNQNPLVLELGCGKGEYSIALAKKFPEKNFVGIDIKGARIWRAAKDATAAGLKNVVFIKGLIEKIEEIFSENEIAEIWIPFPDPYPKPCKSGKRLISPRFLKYYKSILRPGGILHFKTDNEGLFRYAVDTFKNENHIVYTSTEDLYNSECLNEYNSIPTYFENLFLEQGKSIKYIRFALNQT